MNFYQSCNSPWKNSLPSKNKNKINESAVRVIAQKKNWLFYFWNGFFSIVLLLLKFGFCLEERVEFGEERVVYEELLVIQFGLKSKVGKCFWGFQKSGDERRGRRRDKVGPLLLSFCEWPPTTPNRVIVELFLLAFDNHMKSLFFRVEGSKVVKVCFTSVPVQHLHLVLTL